MADNETTADIIAEIRALSNPISDGIIAINGRSIADRLEAAHKRERAKIEADALTVGGMVEAAHKRERGDCAKMREAIAKCVNLITEFGNAEIVKTPLDVIIDIEAILKDALAAPPRNCDRLEAAHRRERGNAAKLREALDESRRIASDLGGCRLNDYWKLNEIVRVCTAALAAPPRNCDRFTSAEEAFHAWNNTVDTPGGGAYVGLMDWLFAPATEKEGGSDGNE